MKTNLIIPGCAKRALLSLAVVAAVNGAGTLSAAVYSAGHGDLGIAYDAGAFDLHLHLHAGAVVDGVTTATDTEFASDGALVYVPNPSVARPASAAFNFTGTTAGSPLWFLPLQQDIAKPFFGIGSEELTNTDWVGNLSLKLVGVNGPGQVSMWATDTFGSPVVAFSSVDGLTGADTYSTIPGSHGHQNIAFTAEGIYALTVRVEGTHVIDGFKQAEATYYFGVNAVPEPSDYGLMVAGALAGFAVLRRRFAR